MRPHSKLMAQFPEQEALRPTTRRMSPTCGKSLGDIPSPAKPRHQSNDAATSVLRAIVIPTQAGGHAPALRPFSPVGAPLPAWD